MENVSLPSPLPHPTICCLQEVVDLFECSAVAWEEENLPLFVELLAQASSLDFHDFSMLMSGPNLVRRACATLSILATRNCDTLQFHTLNVAMSLIDTQGFVYTDGCVSVDKSRNYVIKKQAHGVHSTLRILFHFDDDAGGHSCLPHLHRWKVFHWFAILANCLGNNILSLRCFKTVRQLAVQTVSDTATITELDRDISGLTSHPSNTCCICLEAVSHCFPCTLCGIPSYCSSRCQQADLDDSHQVVCPQLVDWSSTIFPLA